MGWLDRDERNMRRHRPPPEHHDPPLAHVYQTPWGDWAAAYKGIISDGFETEADAIRACNECHYPFDGDGWVLCEEHKGDE